MVMKTALFSVSYAGLWGQSRLELPAFIDRAKALGYRAVMLMGKRPHASILDLDAARRLELRDRLSAAGLETACIAAYTSFTAGRECPEVPFLELQVRYVEELARLAADLDCALVRVFTGYELPGHSPGALWERCVEGLRWCADVARPFGVTLGVQNHHDVALQTEALLRVAPRDRAAQCEIDVRRLVSGPARRRPLPRRQEGRTLHRRHHLRRLRAPASLRLRPRLRQLSPARA